MKKIAFSLLLVIVCVGTNAQKKSGIVYSEHQKIEKSRALWSAFIKGDRESFLSFYADTVHLFVNGKYSKRTNQSLINILDWWDGVSNKKAVDDKGTSPDAIEYNGGGTWVQDWIRLTGTHDKSGVDINVQVHNLYLFKEEGKVVVHHQYFDGSFFDKIAESLTTKENGKVYINHPYINSVRQSMNAWTSKDLDKWMDFFSQDAVFLNNTMDYGDKPIEREEFRKKWAKQYEKIESMQMKEMGYPDCVYYEKGGYHVVYSWWSGKIVYKDGKQVTYPLMLSHSFNKDGKVFSSTAYYSTNHFE